MRCPSSPNHQGVLDQIHAFTATENRLENHGGFNKSTTTKRYLEVKKKRCLKHFKNVDALVTLVILVGLDIPI